MKIVTWNVNGIRSVFRNGFEEWLRRENPDIVCLQEIKADVSDLPENIMFTPEERAQIDKLVVLGYTDTFRALHPDTKAYTWWPYRNNLRERDIGWRIDYIFANPTLLPRITRASMEREVSRGPITVPIRSFSIP